VKTVVITGSTRGIGFGLADEFLKRGCRVVVSGRNQVSTDHAVEPARRRQLNHANTWGDAGFSGPPASLHRDHFPARRYGTRLAAASGVIWKAMIVCVP